MIYLKNNLANANQITNHFSIDYKGIRFHLRIFEEDNLVRNSDYGYNDYVTPYFEVNGVFWEINGIMEEEKQCEIHGKI